MEAHLHEVTPRVSVSMICFLPRFETRVLHNGVCTETVAVRLFNEDDLKSIQSPLEPRSSNLIGGGLYWQ